MRREHPSEPAAGACRRARTREAAGGGYLRPAARVCSGPGELAIVVVVAFVVRWAQLVWASHYDPTFAFPLLDAQVHDWWARGLAFGSWQVPGDMPDPELATTPYYRSPGYPILLALAYAVSGGSYVFARAVQLGAGLGSVVMVWGLARRVLPAGPSWTSRSASGSARRRALVIDGPLLAALLYALSPVAIHFEGQLVAEPWAALLVTAAVCGALALADRAVVSSSWRLAGPEPRGLPALMAAVMVGAAVGAAVVLRPNAVVLLVPVGCALLFVGAGRHLTGQRRRRFALLLWVAAVALLLTAPVTVRNRVRGGEWVWLSLNGPITLLYGNHEAANGHQMRLPPTTAFSAIEQTSSASYPAFKRSVEQTLGRTLTYGELNAWITEQVVAFVERSPRRFLELTAEKALLAVGPHEVSNNEQVALIIGESPVLRWLPARWVLLAVLALVALVLAPRERRRHAAMIALAAAAMLAVTVPFLAASRFRAPVLPLVASLAGPGAALLWRTVRERARGRQAAALLGVLVGVLVFAVPWLDYAPDRARFHLDRGTAYFAAGAHEEGIREMGAALNVAPTYADAYLGRGLAEARRGRYAQAEEDLEAALAFGAGSAQSALASVELQRTLDEVDRLLGRGAEGNPVVALLLTTRLVEDGDDVDRGGQAHPLALLAHARALEANGRTEEAEEARAAARAACSRRADLVRFCGVPGGPRGRGAE